MAKPPFTRFQKGALVFWGASWAILILLWVVASFDEPKFGGWFVVFLGGAALAVGAITLAVVGSIARRLIARNGPRAAVIVGVPLLLMAWFLGPALVDYLGRRPANAYPTGLVLEHLPDGLESTSESWFLQRGTYNVFRSEDERAEVAIGVLTPGSSPRPGETTERDGWVYTVTEHDGYTWVSRKVSGVYVEAAGSGVSLETLFTIVEGADYDQEWDVWTDGP